MGRRTAERAGRAGGGEGRFFVEEIGSSLSVGWSPLLASLGAESQSADSLFLE